MPRQHSHHLGESLIGNKRLENKKRRNKHNYITVNEKAIPQLKQKPDIKSITQQSNLEDFISQAQLSQRDFTSKRPDYKIVVPTHELEEPPQILTTLKPLLRIPRRPLWQPDWTKEQLDQSEKTEFTNWRRNLSLLPQSSLTPYERNIELWRQLWRVLERSHLVVQVLDARNPLLFRCEDLEKYVKEIDAGKEIMLLLNKADLLTPEQRTFWREYFEQEGVDVVFWSAVAEEEIPGVSSPGNLIDIFKDAAGRSGHSEFCVGMIGYPNVGKSSTINALLSRKKTAVSATPGKTKHFQTLHLSPHLVLCDCPGLVMPNFVGDRAELVLSSILPPYQLLDFFSPVKNIFARIPIDLLSKFYNIVFENTSEDKQVEDFLSALCVSRNWMSKRRPNLAKAGLRLVKDYCGGLLLYCHPPPGVEPGEFGAVGRLEERLRGVKVRTLVKEAPCGVLLNRFDETFFAKGRDSLGYGLRSYNPMQMKGRPPRKDGRKLRNIFAHLDRV